MTPQEARDFLKEHATQIEEAESALEGEEEEAQERAAEEEFEENWEEHAKGWNDKTWESAMGKAYYRPRFPTSKFPRPVMVHHEKELT